MNRIIFTVTVLACLLVSGCMAKWKTEAQVIVPNPIADIIAVSTGKPQSVQTIKFQSSQTRANMGGYYQGGR